MRSILAVAVMMLAMTTGSWLQAQENLSSLTSKSVAVSFALPSGGGALIGAKYFLSPTLAVGMGLGYSLKAFETTKFEDGEPKEETEIEAGFTLVPSASYYLLQKGNVAAYAKGALNITKTPGIDFGDALSLDLGAMGGVEYFFVPGFSVGGELGVALNIRNKSKNWSSQTGTGSLMASIYF